MEYSKAYDLFQWEENPFTFKILPELLVGHDSHINRLKIALQAGDKFSLLLGPTGSGKTTVLKYLADNLAEKHIIYISKPPKNPEDWIQVFQRFTKRGFFGSLFSRSNGIDLYNLSDHVNSKLKNEKCYLLIDECHEASLDSLEWLRTITDHTDNLYTVMAALPVFENTLRENLETLMKRINTRIQLTNLTKTETLELIRKRIEHSGGNEIKPFTIKVLDHIYHKTGGFPRDVLQTCNEISMKAIEKNSSIIDMDLVGHTPQEKKLSVETINELPERQRLVVETLSKNGQLTPNEIIAKIDLEEYKDKDNAIRAVNNLLRRLMNDGVVERKRIGKSYRYSVAGKFRTLMVDK